MEKNTTIQNEKSIDGVKEAINQVLIYLFYGSFKIETFSKFINEMFHSQLIPRKYLGDFIEGIFRYISPLVEDATEDEINDACNDVIFDCLVDNPDIVMNLNLSASSIEDRAIYFINYCNEKFGCDLEFDIDNYESTEW